MLETERNLLPEDGTAIYYGPILPTKEAMRHCAVLLKGTSWKSDDIIIFGKRFVTTRQVAWYGDAPYNYRYSGGNKTALKWTEELLALKMVVENYLQKKFNSCLLNLYHNGNEGLGWHSDDETMLGKNPTIASLSLGVERKFSFRHKGTGQIISLFLENGSLLVMQGSTQIHWQHCLPKSKKIACPRINLTFRTIVCL